MTRNNGEARRSIGRLASFAVVKLRWDQIISALKQFPRGPDRRGLMSS